MEKEFDVIIIGAGPAGLECAKQFQGSKLSVLLIEKNKEIGQKVCAGGLTCLSARFNVPETMIRIFNEQTISLSGRKSLVKLVFPIRTVERYDLGQYLLKEIENLENVTVLKEAMVKQVKDRKVLTDKGEFGYKYLVGADGSLSIVRRSLGLKTKVSIGLRYKVPEVADTLEWHLYPEILGSGYLWVFPHKTHTNIGVFFEAEETKIEKAKEVLDEFLKKNSYTFSDRKPESATLNFLYEGCVFGNVFLAGEAAGLTSRTTGEGIAPALISGREIGMKILDPEYEMPLLKEILKIKGRQEFFKKMADIMPFAKKFLLAIFVSLIKTKRFQIYFEGKPDLENK
ncbi:MAG: NAD(P)/FAD-dependent oxidoreductase [Candidatus Paceibacterota bacterium]|jgi:geranylgeranyl reductase